MLCDCNEVDPFTLYTVYEPDITLSLFREEVVNIISEVSSVSAR